MGKIFPRKLGILITKAKRSSQNQSTTTFCLIQTGWFVLLRASNWKRYQKNQKKWRQERFMVSRHFSSMVDTKNKHHSQLIRLCSHKMLIGRTLPPSNVFKTLKQQPSQTKSASITRCNPAFLEEATQIVSQFFTIKMRRKLHLDQMPIGHTKPLTSNRITERILSLKDLWI